jgi:cytochrome c5
MRRTLLSVLAISAVLVACHNKTAPTVATRTTQPEAPAKPAEPVFSTEVLAAGKTIYATKCAKCHSEKPVENWTVEDWKPILKSMIPKARLDSVQAVNVTAYVNANAKKA